MTDELLFPTPGAGPASPQLEAILTEATDDLIALRRDFHAHPELAFQEQRTAGIIAQRLRDLGLEVRERVGRTGVVGRLRGRGGGKIVALRADIDGLPIQELNEVDYASRNAGVMHACAHDGHTAILLTVARALARLRAEFDGEVVFLFQPAEETAGGARQMLAEGALGDPKPQALYGLHLWNNLPAGVVGVREGPLFAHTDELRIAIRGSGGHGAMPHQTVDPIVVAAQVVTALQTIVSRETAPLESGVVTIGSIHGGTAFNIVPEVVELRGTVRTFTDELQALMEERIETLIAGLTGAMRASYSFDYQKHCPAVVNDPIATRFARRVAERTFGPGQVVVPQQTMGGDDMSLFLREVPGTYFFVGTARTDGAYVAPHHHARFDIDERALPVGARLLAETALEFLKS